jgi:hypothetical protein
MLKKSYSPRNSWLRVPAEPLKNSGGIRGFFQLGSELIQTLTAFSDIVG